MDERVDRALRDAMHNKRLIPFVGAGLSQSAAAVPSWPELSTRMIEFARREAGRSAPVRQQLLDMEDLAASNNLIEAFDIGQQLLGYHSAPDSRSAIKYREFLEKEFGQPDVKNATILQALGELRTRYIVTTNYDTLIEDHAVPNWESSTWLEPSKALAATRRGRGVIHLHGRFDAPESLVLSKRDYDTLTTTNEELLNHLSSALFFSGVLLFIGTSLQGLQDPHLAVILDSFGQLSSGGALEESPHYYLGRGRCSAKERARLRLFGVQYVEYGDSYDDLEPFLRGLARRSRIEIRAASMRDLVQRVISASTMSEVIAVAKDHITTAIFANRKVRVGYAAMDPTNDLKLVAKYLTPPGATRNSYIYPATFAGWALATGQITSHPSQMKRGCDFDWLRKIGREAGIREKFDRIETELANDPILHYLDIAALNRAIAEGRATMGDFFQDWEADQPNKRYNQFICVPVPIIDRAGTGTDLTQYGVFNIDSSEGAPLLTAQTEAELCLMSDMVHLCYQSGRFAI